MSPPSDHQVHLSISVGGTGRIPGAVAEARVLFEKEHGRPMNVEEAGLFAALAGHLVLVQHELPGQVADVSGYIEVHADLKRYLVQDV